MGLKPLANKQVMATQPLWLEIPWIRFIWIKTSPLLVLIILLNQLCPFLWCVCESARDCIFRG